MDIIASILGTLFFIWFFLVLLEITADIKTAGLRRSYINLLIKILRAIGTALVKISIPFIREAGEKIVYVAGHYLDKNKPQPPTPQLTDEQGATTAQTNQEPATQNTSQQATQKKSSANPYDDPPEPEIMD